ncbi:glycoside hydrolase family 13 protein [Planoprotostelium fungivorum]|uniref:alpha-amylase n=1 Tax=Planoprotostelium fungivorum TaxID=1890364 RepID=A0A2P6N1E5_9EUKA|nr:glycoside hydrolase family 13 protein [Planoprotostelium fungivorum]
MRRSSLLFVLLIVHTWADEGNVPDNGLPSNCNYATSNLRVTGDWLSSSFEYRNISGADWNPAGPAILKPQLSFGYQCLYSLNVTGLTPGTNYNWKVTARGDWNVDNWGCPSGEFFTSVGADNCVFSTHTGDITFNIETRGPVELYRPYTGTPVFAGFTPDLGNDTIGANIAATPLSVNDVNVQLFEWNWESVGRECVEYLGPMGFGYVQVSPPQETIAGDQWWTSYQATSYLIGNKRGTRDQFRQMVSDCRGAGVKVVVDVLVNHMAGPSNPSNGVSGSPFSHYNYPAVPYNSSDFHSCTADNNNAYDLTQEYQDWYCQLSSLADLATEKPSVRAKIAGHLSDLQSMGVDGFRVDSAKHVPPQELSLILKALPKYPEYSTLEVTYGGYDQVTPPLYQNIGLVQLFTFTYDVYQAFFSTGITSLPSISSKPTSPAYLPSSSSNVFVLNHDLERSCQSCIKPSSGNNSWALSNAFLLAYGYSHPTLFSGYNFSNTDEGAPGGTNITDTVCGQGWRCDHRNTKIANLVGLHNRAVGRSVVNVTTYGKDALAFARENVAYFAMNNMDSYWNVTVYTSLAPGNYCDVISSTASVNNTNCSGNIIYVDSKGSASLQIPPRQAIAFYDQRTPTPTSSSSSSSTSAISTSTTSQITPSTSSVVTQKTIFTLVISGPFNQTLFIQVIASVAKVPASSIIIIKVTSQKRAGNSVEFYVSGEQSSTSDANASLSQAISTIGTTSDSFSTAASQLGVPTFTVVSGNSIVESTTSSSTTSVLSTASPSNDGLNKFAQIMSNAIICCIEITSDIISRALSPDPRSRSKRPQFGNITTYTSLRTVCKLWNQLSESVFRCDSLSLDALTHSQHNPIIHRVIRKKQTPALRHLCTIRMDNGRPLFHIVSLLEHIIRCNAASVFKEVYTRSRSDGVAINIPWLMRKAAKRRAHAMMDTMIQDEQYDLFKDRRLLSDIIDVARSETVSHLMERGAYIPVGLLTTAAIRGYYDLVLVLIPHTNPKHWVPTFHVARMHRHRQIATLLLDMERQRQEEVHGDLTTFWTLLDDSGYRQTYEYHHHKKMREKIYF